MMRWYVENKRTNELWLYKDSHDLEYETFHRCLAFNPDCYSAECLGCPAKTIRSFITEDQIPAYCPRCMPKPNDCMLCAKVYMKGEWEPCECNNIGEHFKES